LLGRDKIGLFTEHIKKLKDSEINQTLLFSIREGSFPQINTNDNLILISTGTGYAPIRNLLWDCVEKQHKGKILLFYGCRNKSKDFLYSEEYEIFQKHLE
jgi:sulfite reductase alpha subunit-like flavoprotein